MTAAAVRVSPSWLDLREPADAAARSADLVEEVRDALPGRGPVTIHDLGCGTGAMARWLAPRLAGPQHWVLHDWDPALLRRAAAEAPTASADGSPVSTETRRGDITRLRPTDLAGAGLVTASAVLDLLTGPELDRLVAACGAASRPTLLTLSVTGHVAMTPHDPLDEAVAAAFNEHQRRVRRDGRLAGPDAPARAAEVFTEAGVRVDLRPSPWRLGSADSALAAAWFSGWLAAAVEQRPRLEGVARDYAARRRADIAAGRLRVTVQHVDVLALP